MQAKSQDSQLWFQEVIQPKLDQLQWWAQNPGSADEIELKKFFLEFLSELELVGLDDYVVEHAVENILDGARTLNHEIFRDEKMNLRELARIAWLRNNFDRAMFLNYWRLYRPFRQKNQSPTDASILNAYWLPKHFQNLIAYIEKSKEADPPVLFSLGNLE